MTTDKIQVRVEGQQVHNFLKKKREASLAKEALEARREDVKTTSRNIQAVRRGGSGPIWKDQFHDATVSNSRVRHLTQLELMTEYGKETKVQQHLEKILRSAHRPLSTKEIEDGIISLGGSPPAPEQLRKMLTLLAERGQVVLLQKRNGTFFPRAKDAPAGTRYFAAWVGTPAASVAKKSGKDNVPSPGTDPASPIPENPGANVGSVSPAAVDKRPNRRKCPSLVPYVRETTRETPRNASDVQDAIYGQTGFAPALSTIRKHFHILKNQGLVNIYAPGRGGKLIPYPTGPSRYVPYVVWKQNDDGVSQPASLRRKPGTAQRIHSPEAVTSPCPQAENNAPPVPAAISPRSETENLQNKDLPRDSVSPPSAALASPDLSPERADQEIPILPDGVVLWMRRLGVTSVTVQVNL